MTTPVPVSAENDITNGAGAHALLMLIGQLDLWESAAPMNHPPGTWAARHSMTTNVKFNEQRIVLDGHDLGPMLQHLPFNDPYRSLKSNRKTAYTASRVRANGTPLACTTATKLNMMGCGDPISLPLVNNVSNEVHNLYIGLAADDEARGDAGIVVSIATDAIAFAISCAGGPPGVAAREIAKDFFGVDPIKMGVGAGLGLAASIINSAASDWQEPITLKLEQGNGFVSTSYELSYNPATGAWDHKGTNNVVGVGKSEASDKIYDPSREPREVPRQFYQREKL